jgi:hypothetical protein
MNRKKFIGIAAGTIVIAGVTYALSSDKSNFERVDLKKNELNLIPLNPDEREILTLASFAPSGHNTQPWFVKYLEPYHWIIGNDKNRWLPAVDSTQRETVLSIGAFLQNLEYAANNLGYSCEFNVLASTNQDENVVEVRLSKLGSIHPFDIEKIKNRRTVRSNYLGENLKKEDLNYLVKDESDSIIYFSNTSKENTYLNEQTIEANRIQAYRDDAQGELANWIRFSSKDVEKYQDGLTVASMEIEGIKAWILRNFYNKEKVMKKNFREQSIDKVITEVSNPSAGWLVITSKDYSTNTLLETGKRLQRLWLKVRDKSIAIHPMTQIIEESETNKNLNASIGIIEPIQFLLRVGYLKDYPKAVSVRRAVEGFVRI